MKTKNVLITDFTDQLFIKAFRQQLLEEHGILEIENFEILFNKLTSDNDYFAYVKVNDVDEVLGFIIGQRIQLSNNYFQEYYGYIKTLWKSEKCKNDSCFDELLSLCEDQFRKMNITQFVADYEKEQEPVFLRNHYVKNKCILHNDHRVFCKK